MKLKIDDKGQAVLQDGKPVYVYDDGREAAFDAPATVATISRLNNEAKTHREAKEAAEGALKVYKDSGLEPDLLPEAVKALTTVKNLGAGELKTAAQVQEIKDAAARSAQEAVAAATRAAEDKLRGLTEERDKLTGQLHSHIIGGAFTSSKFITEKLAIPADIAQTFFGNRFKVEGGKLIATDETGNPMYSSVRHGELMDFEEAIQTHVNRYPNKEMILRGSGASGGGATGTAPNANGKKAVTRAQFDSMDNGSRAAHFKSGGVVVD